MAHEVELVTIGDELLLGFTVDTNSAFLSRVLAADGISVVRRTTVGDTVPAIASAARDALDRTGAVITTGGLGPTTDDVTREAVAEVFDAPLELDETHVAWMQERWRSRYHRDMPESNRRQAMLPRGARKLENRHGSAPGAFMRDSRGRWLAMLPGVPRELRGMTEDALRPLLKELGLGAGATVQSLTLRTTGTAESLLQDRLAGVLLEGLALAYLPGVDGVDLRLTVRGDARNAAAMLQAGAQAVRSAVSDSVYGEGEADLAAILLNQCRAKGISIAVAESCTGGMLGERLTSVPGSSDVFVGGIIAYANEVKTQHLGVEEEVLREHGAVSEPVVRQMARGAIERFGAGLAMAVTGVAGPGGGTQEKPVGLVWICAAVGDRMETRRIHSWGDRHEVRYRACQAVMNLARVMLA